MKAAAQVFGALRARPGDFDPWMLARHDWIARDDRFWSFLCDRLGKGGDDAELIDILHEHWDQHTACGLIPEDVLDAWLRMTERGAEPHPSLYELLARGRLDVEKSTRTRPDLIKRARNALRELGHDWDFSP